MSAATPLSIREHTARSHRVAQGDRIHIVPKDVENQDGVTVEHVRNGVALTPKGALLLRQFEERML